MQKHNLQDTEGAQHSVFASKVNIPVNSDLIHGHRQVREVREIVQKCSLECREGAHIQGLLPEVNISPVS